MIWCRCNIQVRGIFVYKNSARAFVFYIIAAEKGNNTNGKYKLGYCYQHGFGTDVNIEDAIKLYMQAAKEENRNSQK